MDSRKQDVLKTLLYADIFNYPLKKQEIFRYLIANKQIKQRELFAILQKLPTPIENKNSFYFLKGREDLISLRIKREKNSDEKLIKAKKLIEKIALVPFVKFIGVSGALSMGNSDAKDDIDIFVITKENLVWTTRFILVIMLILLGVYRKKKQQAVADKICLNMLVDEKNMVFSKNDQNLYAAHEIAQLLPIFERGKAYEKFLLLNNWIVKFLPNSNKTKKTCLLKTQNSIFDIFFFLLAKVTFVENILMFMQKKYMQKHITKEIIKDGFLSFHPFDYKIHTLVLYKRKLKKFNLVI